MHDSKFRYTSIQLNWNLNTKPHKDRSNYGSSKAIALGTFTRGGVELYFEGEEDPVIVNNRRKWLTFNGSKISHGTAPVGAKGNRFAIIYYKTKPQSHKKRI